MMIHETVTAHPWGNGKWVLHTTSERNILLNEKSFSLYEILCKSGNYEEALILFNRAYGWNINLEDFKGHIAQVFGGYELLKEDFEVERPNVQNQYLKLKIQLINARWAGVLAKPVSWMFNPKYFWKLGVLFILFIVGSALLVPFSLEGMAGADLGIMAGLFYFTMLVHEVGHIAACQNSGIKHGGIGFGFYFIMPVMYADVSNIWLVNKERRVIANMGGIFNELLYSSILLALFWLTGDAKLYLVGITIAIMVVFELNPFVRFDGYWILSDITNTPNLLRKSKTVLLKTLKGFWRGERLPAQEFWLFVYGFFNTALLFFFMGFMLFTYKEEILGFYATLKTLLQTWLSGDLGIELLNRKFLLVLSFYILCGRLLYNYIKKKNLTPNPSPVEEGR